MSTIVTRAGKGSPLTNAEVDANFTNLNTDKYQAGGALGTPASGVVTNLTGTASININGTVGATTPTTAAFTSLAYSTTLTGGTGVVNLGSGQFYKDASGNVGIGVSSPVAKLAVVGGPSNASSLATAYSLATFNITPKSTSGYSLQFGSGPGDLPYIQMSAGGAAAGDMTIQPYGGNVGIGTASPTQKLDVQGNNPTIKVFATNLTGSIVSLELWGSAAGNNFKSAVIQGINYGQLNLETPSGVGVNSFITLSTTATERMRIDSSGNVGIGTASPTRKLNVSATSTSIIGSFARTDGANAYVTFADNTTTSDTYVGVGAAANDLFVRAGNVERMRVTSAGTVGIGTSSPAVSLAISATDAILLPNGTTGQRPTGAAGYIRYNSTTGSFEGYTTAWGSIGGGATGAGGDQIFYENGQTVTTNYTITASKNAGSFGPISINSGITVTVPSGSTWSIV